MSDAGYRNASPYETRGPRIHRREYDNDTDYPGLCKVPAAPCIYVHGELVRVDKWSLQHARERLQQIVVTRRRVAILGQTAWSCQGPVPTRQDQLFAFCKVRAIRRALAELCASASMQMAAE